MALPSLVIATTSKFVQGRKPPAKSSAGNFYVIAQVSGAIRIYKADAQDPETTWTEQDSANAITSVQDAFIDCIQVGDVYHMAYWGTSSIIRYKTFDMSTDTWGAHEDAYTATDAHHDFARISLRSDGNPVICHCATRLKSKGSFYWRVGVSYKSGGSWNYLAIDAGDTYNYTNPTCIKSPNSDAVHLFWASTPSKNAVDEDTVNVRTLRADNTLSTTQSQTFTGRDIHTNLANCIETIDDSGTTRFVVLNQDLNINSELHAFHFEESGGDIVFSATPEVNITDTGDGFVSYVDNYANKVTSALYNNEVHVLAIGHSSTPSTQDIYHTKSGNPNVVFENWTESYATGNAISNIYGGLPFERGGDTVMPMSFFQDDQIFYHEHIIVAGTGGQSVNMDSTENLTLSEPYTDTFEYNHTTADSLTLTENYSDTFDYPVSVTETLTLTEDYSQGLKLPATSSETLSLEESIGLALNSDMWTGSEVGYINEGDATEALAKDFTKTRTTRWIKTPTDTGGVITAIESPIGSSDRGRWQFKDSGTVYYGTDEGTGNKSFRIGGKIDAIRMYYISDIDVHPNATLEVTQADFPVAGQDLNTEQMLEGYFDFESTLDTLISFDTAKTTTWITLPSAGGTINVYTYGVGSENRSRWQWKDSGGTTYWGGDPGGGDVEITLPAEAVQFRIYIGINTDQNTYDAVIKHTPAPININTSDTLTLVENYSDTFGYSAATSESLTLGESYSDIFEFPVTTTELLTVVESYSDAFDYYVSTEGLTLTENSGATRSAPVSTSEGLLSESYSDTYGYAVSTAEGLLTETYSDTYGYPVSTADALSLGEVYSDTLEYPVTTADALSLGEAYSDSFEYPVSVTETLTLTETPTANVTTGGVEHDISTSDAMTLSEVYSDTAEWVWSTAEPLTLGENANSVRSAPVSTSDNLSLVETYSDSLEYYVATDGLALTETPALTVSADRATSDAMTLTEGYTDTFEWYQTAVEALALTEPYSADYEWVQVVTESLTLTESPAIALSASRSTADSMTVSETYSDTFELVTSTAEGTLSEQYIAQCDIQASTADNLTLTEDHSNTTDTIVNVNTSDAMALGEAYSDYFDIEVSTTEVRTPSEVFDAYYEYPVSSGEGALLESSAAAVETSVTTNEALTLTEQYQDVFELATSSSETLTLTETPSGSATYVEASTEVLSLGEVISAWYDWSQGSSENLTLSEVASSTIDWSVSTSEGLLSESASSWVSLVDAKEDLTGTLFTDSIDGGLYTDFVYGELYVDAMNGTLYTDSVDGTLSTDTVSGTLKS